MTRIAVLGANGSIGRQMLDVSRWHEEVQIASLAGGHDWRALADLAREFRPDVVAIRDEAAYPELKAALADLPLTVTAGAAGLCEAATVASADMTLAAISGMAGLPPLLAAIDAGKDIALANKEALIAGGALVMRRIREKGVYLAPVDSEHSALWQCLAGEDAASVARLIITASGGAFRDKSLAELEQVTPADALRHPNWRMGPKITVDCATMVNKGLEVIEAHWLYDMPYEQIDVVVHPESIVHSLVAFRDGCVKAQLGVPDMRLPIQYAVFRQQRPAAPLPLPDLAALGALHFLPPDETRFPALGLFRTAGCRGGTTPAYLNAVNEVLVHGFLAGRLPFLAIPAILRERLDAYQTRPAETEEAIYAADREGRAAAQAAMEAYH